MSVINQAIGMYVPTKQLFSTHRKHFKQYTLYIQKLQNKKCAAWKLYKRFHTDGTKSRYMQCDKQCRVAIDRFINC